MNLVGLRDLLSLTKPRVTILVAATTLVGLLLAPKRPGLMVTLLALIGTFAVVGAANALNCWMERDLDGEMARTRTRPLPSGRLSPRVALVFGIGLGVGSLLLLGATTNLVTALLALIALAAYVVAYTPLKQRSPMALLVGAVPGAIPPLMGWTAATGQIEVPGLILLAIVFLWQVPHFVAIGVLHLDDYARAGYRTLPVVFGPQAAFWVASLATAALVPASLALAPAVGLGASYVALALVLGIGFLAACGGCIHRSRDRRAVRRLLLSSLAYLPLLFVAVGVGRA